MSVALSFIVPCRNEETDVELTVRACLGQDGGATVEVLAVDNGSTDGTGAILRRIGEEDARLIVLDGGQRPSVSHARNVGIAASSGAVLVFMNADEIPDREFATSILGHISSGCELVFPWSRVFNVEHPYGRYREAYWISRHRLASQFRWSQGFACTRAAAVASGGFDERYPGAGGEDWDFVARLEPGKARLVDRGIVVRHRVPEGVLEVAWHMFSRGRGSAYFDILGARRLPWVIVAATTYHLAVWALLLATVGGSTSAIWRGALAAIMAGYALRRRIGEALRLARASARFRDTPFFLLMSVCDGVLRAVGYSCTVFRALAVPLPPDRAEPESWSATTRRAAEPELRAKCPVATTFVGTTGYGID